MSRAACSDRCLILIAKQYCTLLFYMRTYTSVNTHSLTHSLSHVLLFAHTHMLYTQMHTLTLAPTHEYTPNVSLNSCLFPWCWDFSSSFLGRAEIRGNIQVYCNNQPCGLMWPTEGACGLGTCVTTRADAGKAGQGGSCVYGNSFLVCLLCDSERTTELFKESNPSRARAEILIVSTERKPRNKVFLPRYNSIKSGDDGKGLLFFLPGRLRSKEGHLLEKKIKKLVLNLLPSSQVNIGPRSLQRLWHE